MPNHLKPMGVREILDSTFSIMRDRFWTFQYVAFKASLPPLFILLGGLLISIIYIAILSLTTKIPFDSPQFITRIFQGNILAIICGVIILIAWIMSLFVSSIIAFIHFNYGTVKVYQSGFHQQPCSAKDAFNGIKGKKLRIFLVGFVVSLIIYIISIPGMIISSMLMTASPFIGYIVYFLNIILEISFGFFVCLTPIVAAIEELDVFSIIKRSFNLLTHYRWKVFWSVILVYLLANAIWFIFIGLAASPLIILIFFHAPLIIGLVVTLVCIMMLFVLSMMAIYHFGPLTAIYYDLLIRKEGYDLLLQLTTAEPALIDSVVEWSMPK